MSSLSRLLYCGDLHVSTSTLTEGSCFGDRKVFWRVCGELLMDMSTLCNFSTDLCGFGSTWGAFQEAMRFQCGSEDGWKSEKFRFVFALVGIVGGMRNWIRFWDDFLRSWKSKTKEKCGRVCSDSIFSARRERLISDAFGVGFWKVWVRFWRGFRFQERKSGIPERQNVWESVVATTKSLFLQF